MKQLIIRGNKEEVKQIINSLLRRHGNITIDEYLTKMGMEKVSLQ